MKRKDFLKTALLTASSVVLPTKSFPAEKNRNKKKEIIKPLALKDNATIGLIAPASYIDENELIDSKNNLADLGFKTLNTDRILKRFGYLAGDDKNRADDLNEMFSRKDVDAIVCVRGGYGCARMLDMIDYKLIKKNPKILIGYSDITALLFALYSQVGLITFHGPVGTSTFNNYSIDSFVNVLMYGKKNYLPPLAEDDLYNEDLAYSRYTINSGKTQGILIGGNLSIVVSMLGTKYDVDYSGKIIFLEEIGEEPYRIDRMLSQLILAGKFKNAAGIVLGVFRNCERKRINPSFEATFKLRDVLEDRLKGRGIPVFYGFSFGHVTNKITIPFGIKAEMDADNFSLKYLESAVLK